jgi:hypothetical protein
MRVSITLRFIVLGPSSSNLVYAFQLPCCWLVGENQGVVALNPAGWDRRIAFAQARERRSFVLSGHEP